MPGPGATTRRGRVRRSRQLLGAVLAVVLLLTGTTACSSDDPPAAASAHPVDTDQANRLAVARFSLYQAGTVAVDAQVVSDDGTLQFSGWLDTVGHRGYGLVSAAGVQPFLSFWTTTDVSAQSSQAQVAPLPVPDIGWETFALQQDSSILAAAQQLLVSLANDRPENPQLLLQSGATWLRTDTVGSTPVDVVSGPVPEGATDSSYRYWIDESGTLLRVEARLDGRNYSRFTVTPATGVDLEPPG